MRTTVSLDEDVVALIESERQSRGESFRVAINRMLRASAQRGSDMSPPLPLLSGTPRIDITDVSAALAEIEDEHLLGKGLY